MKKPMNMIKDMNYAWESKNKYDAEEFEVRFKNLLSHGFVDVERRLREFYKSEGYTYDEDLFFAVRRIMTYFMYADDDLLRGEYDAYVKYCNWANFNPLTPDQLLANYQQLNNDIIIKDIRLITAMRNAVDPDNYAAFVQALCFFCLMGDKAMDENEYHILRCFYEDGYDYSPSTWEQFKKEW